MFVISPYIRTSQTAQPTLEKFPSVPVENWPIYEYTYLNAEQYANTTKQQRGIPSLKYFMKLDSDLNLGTGAESYNEFIQRVDNCLDKIKELDQKFIILFGHGWFIKATLWRLLQSKALLGEQEIFINEIAKKLPSSAGLLKTSLYLKKRIQNPIFPFLLFSSAVIIPNTSIVKFNLETDTGKISIMAFEFTHIHK